LPINADSPVWFQLLMFILTGYLIKVLIALLDTIPFYIGVNWLKSYLEFDPQADVQA